MMFCGVVAGADDFVAIARFANTKKDWFAKFLDMTHGVPSHDRFSAILNAIKPDEFEPILLAWLTELHKITNGQVIAIDGKTLRRSYNHASGKAAIHMVSAWEPITSVSSRSLSTRRAMKSRRSLRCSVVQSVVWSVPSRHFKKSALGWLKRFSSPRKNPLSMPQVTQYGAIALAYYSDSAMSQNSFPNCSTSFS